MKIQWAVESIVKHSAGSYHQPNRLQWKWLCTITKLHPSKPPGFQTSRLEWSLKEHFPVNPSSNHITFESKTGKTKLFQQLGNPQPQNVKALTPFKIWEIDVVERSHMENGNLKCFRRLYITEMNYRKHGQNHFSTYHIPFHTSFPGPNLVRAHSSSEYESMRNFLRFISSDY